MNSISVNKFRDNLKSYVEQTIENHTPLKVTRRTGEDFVVISAEDWEREPEPLKHNLSGLWSRRLSQKGKLIYMFDDDYIYIFAIGGHYDQL